MLTSLIGQQETSMSDTTTLPASVEPRACKADKVAFVSVRAPETKAAVPFLPNLDQIIVDAERLHAMIR